MADNIRMLNPNPETLHFKPSYKTHHPGLKTQICQSEIIQLTNKHNN